jgi:hypothetical protein
MTADQLKEAIRQELSERYTSKSGKKKAMYYIMMSVIQSAEERLKKQP